MYIINYSTTDGIKYVKLNLNTGVAVYKPHDKLSYKNFNIYLYLYNITGTQLDTLEFIVYTFSYSRINILRCQSQGSNIICFLLSKCLVKVINKQTIYRFVIEYYILRSMICLRIHF